MYTASFLCEFVDAPCKLITGQITGHKCLHLCAFVRIFLAVFIKIGFDWLTIDAVTPEISFFPNCDIGADFRLRHLVNCAVKIDVSVVYS